MIIEKTSGAVQVYVVIIPILQMNLLRLKSPSVLTEQTRPGIQIVCFKIPCHFSNKIKETVEASKRTANNTLVKIEIVFIYSK